MGKVCDPGSAYARFNAVQPRRSLLPLPLAAAAAAAATALLRHTLDLPGDLVSGMLLIEETPEGERARKIRSGIYQNRCWRSCTCTCRMIAVSQQAVPPPPLQRRVQAKESC